MNSYTGRSAQTVTVEEVGDNFVSYEGGMGMGMPDALRGKIKVGDMLVLETRNFSTVTGVQNARTGEWYYRKTDEDLDREHREFVEKLRRDREERWGQVKDDLLARTAALPDWLRDRIESFRASGGHHFETDGWEYELVVCELAALYAANHVQDDDAVMAYAHLNGTSGNQHEFAKALARARLEDQDFRAGGTMSALSPITGDADYSGKES